MDRIRELREKARTLRKHVVRMTGLAGSGHPGGSLSAADIVAALYFHTLRYNPKDPQWRERDRFILSKGHAAPLLYATLAEAGYIPVEMLDTLRRIDSSLEGHPDRRKVPGVEVSSGSLGQGLSIGIGMALAGMLDGKDYHVYVLLGDGEMDEGQIWQDARLAVAYQVHDLTAIVDCNGFQLDGATQEIMNLEPLAEKWRAFGWHVQEIDGHDMEAILEALEEAKRVRDQPSLILARTIKGKGVSFMENNNDFHGIAPNREQMERALAELSREEA